MLKGRRYFDIHGNFLDAVVITDNNKHIPPKYGETVCINNKIYKIIYFKHVTSIQADLDEYQITVE